MTLDNSINQSDFFKVA